MHLSGWGRYPVVRARAASFSSTGELAARLAPGGPAIPYGLGRSYGDSALGGDVLLTRRLSCILDFDPQAGEVTCEAGVSLAELVDAFLPRGWFLAVTPGTRHVTVGGAIASDVHGKNHHVAGCFSEGVLWLELMLPDGRVVRCSATQNERLFRATCGGMGLTGVIVAARLRLARVTSSVIEQKTIKAANLEDIFALFDRYASYTYSVAWIDCLAKGEALGRSLLMVGEHAPDGGLEPLREARLGVPVDMPSCTLNSLSVKLFNALYYGRVRGREADARVGLGSFFYPLDAVRGWNRVYGKRGFTQYQFVLPLESSLAGMRRVLEEISAAGMGSFLAVLKLFGGENGNLLSFPREGYTLALDFRIEPRLFGLLDRLDAVVLDHGGRLYLTKDVRMSPETFRKGYPRLGEFMELRREMGFDRHFQSLQSTRLEY